MRAFEQQVAVVVGGGRGIGRATALALASEGARVLVQDAGVELDGSGHDERVAHAVAEEIRDRGGQAVAVCSDVRERGATHAAIHAALTSFGRVDVGLYAAGIVREKAFLRAQDEDLDVVLDIQARAAFRFTREFAQQLVDQRSPGSIVLCSAPAGFVGVPAQAGLSAAALAVVGFARTVATELRRQQIRVNVLVPTALTRATETLPLFRAIRADSLTAEHVAQVACHLLSATSDPWSGEIVGVAGGRVYTFQIREEPGLFFEGPPQSLAALAARLPANLRG